MSSAGKKGQRLEAEDRRKEWQKSSRDSRDLTLPVSSTCIRRGGKAEQNRISIEMQIR